MKNESNKIRLLLEMRPALEGFAGIPQEVRLLFRGLRTIDSVDVEGLLQNSHRGIARGTSTQGLHGLMWRTASVARRYKRYSNVIISMSEKPHANILEIVLEYLQRRGEAIALQASMMVPFSKIELSQFESRYFEDFTWRTLFSKTLRAVDFALVTSANFRICRVGWHTLQSAGLATLNWRRTPRYPLLDTGDFDIFIGQTPFPGRFAKRTVPVIRYHDAIPVFMPHTINEKSRHQAIHFYALMSNVADGAWFACVSEATRADLLRLFPEAAGRAVTLHNMVSPHYFPEDANSDRVREIIRARLYEASGVMPKFFGSKEKENFYKRALFSKKFSYFVVVSTLEPRKNHSRLLAAWEVVKSECDRDVKLVVVGTLGWQNSALTASFQPWIDRGELFMLNAVPAPDLRVLYRNAAATVCPSLAEGFDFSGVEAMRCGGIAIASDIAAHREVYEDAAEYFDPYSTMSLVDALRKVLYAPDAQRVQERLRQQGQEISRRYLPEQILPQWEKFLHRVLVERSKAG